MPRLMRQWQRRPAFRDASKIIIAVEGSKTEYRYFAHIVTKDYFYNPRVETVPLERDPATIGSFVDELVSLIDVYKKKNRKRLTAADEYWVVVDRDPGNISVPQLAAARRVCGQKRYQICLSSPCFELWLLMHRIDVTQLKAANRDRIQENEKVNKNRRLLDTLLIRLLGGYNKSNPPIDKLYPDVIEAIENSKRALAQLGRPWPYDLGSDVHLLVERVLP